MVDRLGELSLCISHKDLAILWGLTLSLNMMLCDKSATEASDSLMRYFIMHDNDNCFTVTLSLSLSYANWTKCSNVSPLIRHFLSD